MEQERLEADLEKSMAARRAEKQKKWKEENWDEFDEENEDETTDEVSEVRSNHKPETKRLAPHLLILCSGINFAFRLNCNWVLWTN